MHSAERCISVVHFGDDSLNVEYGGRVLPRGISRLFFSTWLCGGVSVLLVYLCRAFSASMEPSETLLATLLYSKESCGCLQLLKNVVNIARSANKYSRSADHVHLNGCTLCFEMR